LTNKSPLSFNFDRTNAIAFSKREFRGKSALTDAFYKNEKRMRLFPAVISPNELPTQLPILYIDREFRLSDKMDRLIYTSDMKSVGMIV
jgi:hypothetical protein